MRLAYLAVLTLVIVITGTAVGEWNASRLKAQTPGRVQRVMPLIDAAGLKTRKEDIVVLDIRERSAFHHAHIRGAINIPAIELEVRLEGEVPKKKQVAIYCDFNPACNEVWAKSGATTPCEYAIGVANSLTRGRHHVISSTLRQLEQGGVPVTVGVGLRTSQE